MALRGARIALLEGRLTEEFASLVRRHGGVPYYAPAVREGPVDCGEQAAAFIEELAEGSIQVVVFLTGAGARGLFQQAERLGRLQELLAALRRAVTVCRGPKPAAVLKRSGVSVAVGTGEPHTAAELVQALEGLELASKGVALVHYGERSPGLAESLAARGARLHELCLYQWLLPEDTRPLEALVNDVMEGRVDAVAFTSQVQARHLFQVAAALDRAPALARALTDRTVVASIGPTCTAALRALGVSPQVVPQHPKMGHLVLALAQHMEARAQP